MHDANTKKERIDWLKGNIHEDEIRILTNARCLSEGVDVPSLDAILFLESKKSPIDIIQAIGRVMRKIENKKYGYIIIPIFWNSDDLNIDDIDKFDDYKEIVKYINAIRSYDDRLEKVFINGLPDNFLLKTVNGDGTISNWDDDKNFDLQKIVEFKEKIQQKLIEKLSDRHYWDSYSDKIVKTWDWVIKELKNENIVNSDVFKSLSEDFKNVINQNVSDDDILTMVCQHLIIKKILKIVFIDKNIIEKNVFYRLFEQFCQNIDSKITNYINDELKKIYKNLEDDLKNNKNQKEYRQKFLKNLFESVFKKANPKEQDSNGIVYTPNEIVDFMVNSVNDILKDEFDKDLSSEDVKILDPFTGTGTYIISVLNKINEISKNNIKLFEKKYKYDIYSNEINLLAYYISLINIEEKFYDITDKYLEFNNSIFGDTFQIYEYWIDNFANDKQQIKFFSNEFNEISNKQKEEAKEKFTLIIGNPPYFVGQQNTNQNIEKIKHPKLENSIREEYDKLSNSNHTNSLYDSYIKAFKISFDLIQQNGIVAFITNNGYIENKSFNIFRKKIFENFSNIYIFDLRGNIRKRNKLEGANIFGNKCGCGVSVIFLVKNNLKLQNEKSIKYCDINKLIDDVSKTKIKLNKIKELNSFFNVEKKYIDNVFPNEFHDWINQRPNNENWNKFIPICTDKANNTENYLSIYNKNFSNGIMTSRDQFIYNYDKNKLIEINKFIVDYYKNAANSYNELKKEIKNISFYDYVSKNYKKFKWSKNFNTYFKNNEIFKNIDNYNICQFRLFAKKYINLNTKLIARMSKWINILGLKNNLFDNKVINLSWSTKKFSCFSSNLITDLHFFSDIHSIPLYLYENEKDESQQCSLDFNENFENKKYSISDEALEEFRKKYKDDNINAEDVFYYIYAIFQSNTYVEKYKSFLMQEIPRIPFLQDFKKWSKIGNELMDLHLNYENCDRYLNVKFFKDNQELTIEQIDNLDIQDFEIKKIVIKEEEKTIYFNNNLKITNLPDSAFDYKVGDLSPIEHVALNYKYKIDKDYNIVDDPNKYDPDKGGKYIFDLLLSLITMSEQTQKLLDQLPEYKEI